MRFFLAPHLLFFDTFFGHTTQQLTVLTKTLSEINGIRQKLVETHGDGLSLGNGIGECWGELSDICNAVAYGSFLNSLGVSFLKYSKNN